MIYYGSISYWFYGFSKDFTWNEGLASLQKNKIDKVDANFLDI